MQMITRPCLVCGTGFTTPTYRLKSGRGKYCSRKCSDFAHRRGEERQCEVCGSTFYAKRKRLVGKYCSHKCQGIDRRGDRSHHWKGGADKRNTFEYRHWRNSVFARDNWICQDCGDKKGGNLRAHHIFPFADFPEHRFELWNGVTLCDICHQKCHPNLKFIEESTGSRCA